MSNITSQLNQAIMVPLQMYACAHRPYQPVGDPFSLEQARLLGRHPTHLLPVSSHFPSLVRQLFSASSDQSPGPYKETAGGTGVKGGDSVTLTSEQKILHC